MTIIPTMVRPRNTLAHLRAQLWLLPGLMTVAASLIAYFAVTHGGAVQRLAGQSAWWLYSGDATTARNLLSAFLSGLITMTSLVVSMTIVILTTAASQLGPRLITHFIGDRQIQFALGLFISTTFYIIIVMRTLQDKLGPEGVPHAAITMASALTMACLFSLLLYVHKIARSVIADNLVEEVWLTLRANIQDILGDDAHEDDPPIPEHLGDSLSLSLERPGYLQLVDYPQLVTLASKRDLIIRINVRAGHFVLAGDTHIDVWNAGASQDGLEDAVRSAVVLGASRTPAQDLEYGLRQLVEIGLRALSPGINDPFTASAVIDRLGAALEEIFARSLSPCVFADEERRVRVIANRSDLSGLLGAAFSQLRQAGATHPAILIDIARTLGRLAPSARSAAARQALLGQITRLAQTSAAQSFSLADEQDVSAEIEAAWTALTGAAYRA